MTDTSDANIKFGNHANFIHHSKKSFIFQEELILTISKSYLFNSDSTYTLKKLPINSDSKVVSRNTAAQSIIVLHNSRYFGL